METSSTQERMVCLEQELEKLKEVSATVEQIAKKQDKTY